MSGGGQNAAAGARDEWRRGWPAVAAAGIALSAGPSFYLYVSSLFVEPVEQAFAWSRSQMTTIAAIPLLGALVAPLIGWLVDRFGIYKVALPSFALLGIAFFGLSQAQGQVGEVAAWMLLLGIAVPGATAMTISRPVVTWFNQSRGLALGVMAAMVTVFTALLAPLLGQLIALQGFRVGYMALGICAIGVGIPVMLFFLKEKPVDDLHAPSAEARAELPAKTESPAKAEDAGGFLTLLRRPAYWTLLAAIILPNIPIGGIVTQLTPIVTARGVNAADAGIMLTLYALSAFGGRIIIGLFFDRFNAARVAALISLIAMVGTFMLHTSAPSMMLYFGVLTVGVMHGAEVDVGAFFSARMFPHALFGSAMGGVACFGMIGTAVGAVGFGRLFDKTGGYDTAIVISSLMFLASAALFLALTGAIRRGHHVTVA